MADNIYCYPESDVLINKLNIKDRDELFEAEKQLTFVRLQELQLNPIEGKFDFDHLKAIHRYIFQDLYDWAGEERTVEIGKGNLFCTTAYIQEYARAVFSKYHSQCYSAKDDFEEFVKVFAENYGDLNALHPFREGNGRSQREFARLICRDCGYDFDLSCTTHKDMLEASKLSFNQGDSSLFIEIFSKALRDYKDDVDYSGDRLSILTSDDLDLGAVEGYEYYDYYDSHEYEGYSELYKAKIESMSSK